ncbi:MAG: hypothetical protein ACYDGY_09165 [Acidimicrobiales bacterium]
MTHIVPLGTVLLGTVLLGTVLLGTVLLGTVLPPSRSAAKRPRHPHPQRIQADSPCPALCPGSGALALWRS